MRIRDLHKQQTIRQKALKMVVREGFDGLSMHKLATAAGVSPATIYIYFKDREDLLLQLCIEEYKKMTEATLRNFDPAMSFSDGLRLQWMNRAHYYLAYPDQMSFLEQVRHSPLYEKALQQFPSHFKEVMTQFVQNSIQRNELVKVPIEVYWSVAFTPLYNLIRFHIQGKSLMNEPFILSEEMILQTLELVLKALRPEEGFPNKQRLKEEKTCP